MEEFFKKTILLVEDEPGIRRSEKVLLENAGYSVAEASNADEALNAVSGEKTDIGLVVMNVMFKTGDDGARAAKAILEIRDLPVVFTSYSREKNAMEKTRDVAAYGHVLKDYSEFMLVPSVENAIKLFAKTSAGKQNENSADPAEPAWMKKIQESQSAEKGKYIDGLSLEDVIDINELKSIMEDFYSITSIPGALINSSGKILITVGWQDICSNFHRVNPRTRKNCIESDTNLATGVEPGKFKTYKCLNNMWDMVTPITVEGKNIGNLYLGQFFFEDEIPDMDFFRKQAERFGFNTDDYLAAVKKAPKIKHELCDSAMKFYSRLAGMLSSAGYAKIKLQISLEEKKYAELALRKSEESFRMVFDHAPMGLILFDNGGKIVICNNNLVKIIGSSREKLIGLDMTKLHDKEIVKAVNLAISGTASNYEGDYSSVTAKKITPVHILFAPTFTSDGKSFGGVGIVEDVSERKRAEAEMAKSRRFLSDLIENSGALIYAKDADGRYLFINRKWEDTTGITRENVIGHTDMELFAERLAEKFRQNDMEVMQSNMTIETEEMLERDNATRYFISIKFPLRDENGIVNGVCGMSTEITERKIANDIIRLNEARLQSLMRISQHEGDSIQDLLDFALEEAIKLTESKIGYIYFYDESKQQFTLNTWSKGVMDQCSVTQPQTVYELSKTGIWGEAVRQRKPIIINDFSAPNPLKKGMPEGHAPLHKFLTIPVFSQKQIVAVLGVANKQSDYDESDIRQLTLMMDPVWTTVERRNSKEALRQSEEKLRAIFDNNSTGIAMLEPDTTISMVNDAYCRMSGYSREEVIGRSWTELVPENEVKRLLDYNQNTVSVESDAPVRYEYRTYKKGGEIRYGLISSSPIKSTSQTIVSFLDITDLRQAEEQLQHANDELLAANEEMEAINEELSTSQIELLEREAALRESEERLRLSLKINKATVFEDNFETGEVISTPELYHNLGYDTSEIPHTIEEMKNLIHPDDISSVMEKVKDHFDGRTAEYNSEFRMRAKSGEWRWVDGNGQIIRRNSQGEPTVLLGISRDINDRKISEEKIKNLLKEKELILKEVHHRVKNNMLSIMGLLKVQANTQKNSEIKNTLNDSAGRIKSMMVLYDKLYRSENINALSVKEYLPYLANEIVSTFPHAKIVTIKTDIDDVTLGSEVLSPLGIIINELITNSMKYAFTGREKGTIEIKLKASEKNITITFKDDGSGTAMPLSMKNSTGFGLQLVDMLSRQIGAEVSVESENGTCFTISIPV